MNDNFGSFIAVVVFGWCLTCAVVVTFMLLFENESTIAALDGYIKKYETCIKENALKPNEKCGFIVVVSEVTDNE